MVDEDKREESSRTSRKASRYQVTNVAMVSQRRTTDTITQRQSTSSTIIDYVWQDVPLLSVVWPVQTRLIRTPHLPALLFALRNDVCRAFLVVLLQLLPGIAYQQRWLWVDQREQIRQPGEQIIPSIIVANTYVHSPSTNIMTTSSVLPTSTTC